MHTDNEHQTYTLDDILALPDHDHAELINGTLYHKPYPSRHHQRILFFLLCTISNHIHMHHLPFTINAAPFSVYLRPDEQIYVEPDLFVTYQSSALTSNGYFGAPDWIIEITESDTQQMDYSIKLFQYQKSGVREYWIVDFSKNRITTYNFEANDYNEYTCSDPVPCETIEKLTIHFSLLSL